MTKTLGNLGFTTQRKQMHRGSLATLCVALLGLSFSYAPTASADTPIEQVLPFARPSIATLRASPHKVCAMWHRYAISVDNKPAGNDWYETQEVDPHGYNNLYYKAGGRMRQRPLTRPVITAPDWRTIDMETEIRRASDIGIDCFFYSFGTDTVNWNNFVYQVAAAKKVDNGFKIVPMMDAASLANRSVTAATVATQLAKIVNGATTSALMRDKNGRIYISGSNSEGLPPAWWSNLKAEMSKRGISVSLIPVLQSFDRSVNAFLPIVDGSGSMGPTTPREATGTKENANLMHAHDKIYIAGVRPQVFRPKNMVYKEAGNSQTLRDGMTDAISGGADWIVFQSWCDRTEATEIAPSTGTQWAPFDMSAYYITWLKTGKAPTITRDVLYYSHRIMWTTTPYNHAKQPQPFADWAPGQPKLNDIELVGFLTNPGTLQIQTNGKTYTKDAPAGITSFRAPLAAGYPNFKLLRGGKTQISMQSAFLVRNTTTWQDFLYRGGSSNRPVVDMVANPPVTN